MVKVITRAECSRGAGNVPGRASFVDVVFDLDRPSYRREAVPESRARAPGRAPSGAEVLGAGHAGWPRADERRPGTRRRCSRPAADPRERASRVRYLRRGHGPIVARDCVARECAPAEGASGGSPPGPRARMGGTLRQTTIQERIRSARAAAAP